MSDRMVSLAVKNQDVVWIRASQVMLIEPVGSYRFRVELISTRRIESKEFNQTAKRDEAIQDLLRRMAG